MSEEGIKKNLSKRHEGSSHSSINVVQMGLLTSRKGV